MESSEKRGMNLRPFQLVALKISNCIDGQEL